MLFPFRNIFFLRVSNSKSWILCSLSSIHAKSSENFIYQCNDTKPKGSKNGTLITVHGAPGSHKDFKYITPILQKKDIRIIGINMPGMGYTSFDERLEHDSDERINFIKTIIDQAGVKDKLIITGHSRGSVDAISLAAKLKKDGYNVVGLIPINFIGFRPHRGIRPYWGLKLIAWLWSIQSLRFIYSYFVVLFYKKILKMNATAEIAGNCLTVMSKINFKSSKNAIEYLNKTDTKILPIYSGNDFLTETQISREVASSLDNNIELICSTKNEDDKTIINKTVDLIEAGEKHISVYFTEEGHYLQKFRAKFLIDIISAILKKN